MAPYEADSQLAFLASLPAEAGGVAAVITEDSDLVAYGVRTLLFKCDRCGTLATRVWALGALMPPSWLGSLAEYVHGLGVRLFCPRQGYAY